MRFDPNRQAHYSMVSSWYVGSRLVIEECDRISGRIRRRYADGTEEQLSGR